LTNTSPYNRKICNLCCKVGENLTHFAAFKKHIGLYPVGEAASEFAERLVGYKTSKGAIQLPLGKPIDYELITDIVRWRLKQVEG
jgi:uncharacterized protein YdhG (YjbR/CyaY superfamily)